MLWTFLANPDVHGVGSAVVGGKVRKRTSTQ